MTPIQRLLAITLVAAGASLVGENRFAMADDSDIAAALSALDRRPGQHGEVLYIRVTDDASLPPVPKVGYVAGGSRGRFPVHLSPGDSISHQDQGGH